MHACRQSFTCAICASAVMRVMGQQIRKREVEEERLKKTNLEREARSQPAPSPDERVQDKAQARNGEAQVQTMDQAGAADKAETGLLVTDGEVHAQLDGNGANSADLALVGSEANAVALVENGSAVAAVGEGSSAGMGHGTAAAAGGMGANGKKVEHVEEGSLLWELGQMGLAEYHGKLRKVISGCSTAARTHCARH